MKKCILTIIASIVVITACGGNPRTQTQSNDRASVERSADAKKVIGEKDKDSNEYSKSTDTKQDLGVKTLPSNNSTTKNNSLKKESTKTPPVEKSSSGNFLYFVILLLAIVGEGYLVLQLWKDNKKFKIKLDRIYDILQPKIGRVEYSNSDTEVIKLLNEIKSELRNNILVSNRQEKTIENSNNPIVPERKISENKAESKPTEYFLKIKGRDSFKETENRDEADCFVYTDNGIFQFFTDKEHALRLARNRDKYKDVVDFEGDANRTTSISISILKPGRCEFNKENNVWIVKEKTKIKFV